MAGVRIVTDSACDLPEDIVADLGIEIVPLSIRFGNEELVDRTELSARQFYERMAQTDQLPETAAPAPGQFERAFRKLADDGADGIVCLNLSSALSATMQSARTAAGSLNGGVDVRVVDSHSITAGLGIQVRELGRAAADGRSIDDIAALADDLARRSHVFGALDTLENLKKGGRIGGAQALVGTLLSIKPLVDISSGEVEEAGKQRTRRKALLWLRDRLFAEDAPEQVAVCHGEAPDIDEFLDLLAPRYSRDDLTLMTIGPVIGTHGGPRVVGVAWLEPSG